ncbi:MAG: hypothetical protein EB072_19865, partial [Betaproteobacteria bacterium]|nr:hypothetical protein [Betaproteobacteria bacterium]
MCKVAQGWRFPSKPDGVGALGQRSDGSKGVWPQLWVQLKTLDDRTPFGQGKLCSSLVDELNQVPCGRTISVVLVLQAQTLKDVSGRIDAEVNGQLKADGSTVLLVVAITQRGNATASRSNLLNQTSEAVIP